MTFANVSPGRLVRIGLFTIVCCVCAAAAVFSPWGEQLQAAFEAARPAARISGSVRDAHGSPIAGAQVCAMRVSASERRGEVFVCANGDRAGQYVLHEIASGAHLLSVRAPGYAAGGRRDSELVVATPGTRVETVDVRLDRGGAEVRGQVRDAAGQPLAGARLRVTRWDAPRLGFEIAGDERGRFDITMPAGPYELEVRAPGHATVGTHGVAPDLTASVALSPAVPLRGRVIDARSGKPVAGVAVRAVPRDRMPRIAWTRSDARGEFSFTDISAGSYLLVANGEGTYGELASSVELTGEADAVVNLGVYPAYELRGTVHVGRTPCRDGHVLLGEPDSATRESDEERAANERPLPLGPDQFAAIGGDGVVEFGGVPPGRYFVSVVCRGAALDAGPRVLELPRDAKRELAWTMKPEVRLRARVIDGRGAPASDARIGVAYRGRDRRHMLTPALTDENGEAEFALAACTECRLVASDSAELAPPVPFQLALDGRRGEATLEFAGQTPLVVVLRDERGTPLNDLQVFARTPEDARSIGRVATALGDGRYRFPALPVGSYSIVADDGANPAEFVSGAPVEVRAGGEQRIEVELPRGGAFSGRVLDALGQPARRAWVSALVEPSADVTTLLSGRTPRRTMTDDAGRFHLVGLDPRSRFAIRADRFAGSAVLLDARAPEEALVLQLPDAAHVAGRVVDEHGKPVEQFVIRAQLESAQLTRDRQVAHAAGEFRWALPPGRVVLSVFTGTGQTGTHELDLVPGQTLEGISVQLGAADR